MLTVLDLFSGIGGFSLGLERTGGFRTVMFCEIDAYCRRVLARHWPGVPIAGDVTRLSADHVVEATGGRPDVVCGGFPCQDISAAGKGAGIEGDRSGLWGELARVLGELRPRYAIVENVPRLLSGGRGEWFGRVLGDLAEIGYDAEWHSIPAAAVGAPHRRDRVWIVAHPVGGGCQAGPAKRGQGKPVLDRTCPSVADTSRERCGEARRLRCEQSTERATGCGQTMADAQGDGRRQDVEPVAGTASGEALAGQLAGILPRAHRQWRIEPDVGRVAHGVPARVDRLNGLGNAVVPQVVEVIGQAILAIEAERRAA